jgi:AAA15 family ATPase/GTPase
MKLREFRVREFRSIWDSGPIKVDDKVTCFVGKNEAGKTALLKALYKTNPIIENDATFSLTYDYPKREVEDYRFAVENGERDEVVVVESRYELDEADSRQIENIFGPNVLKERTFTLNSHYEDVGREFSLSVDEHAAREYLSNNSALSDEFRATLKEATDWDSFAAALEDTEGTEAVKKLQKIVAEIQKDGFQTLLRIVLKPRLNISMSF